MHLLRTQSPVLALVALLVGAPGALAHHGWSGYRQDQPRTLTGTLHALHYGAPHGTVELRTEEGTAWHVVLAPPSRMQQRGLPPELLAEGTRATVVAYPHRTAPAEVRAERITVGGKTVELR